jgi:hypothetical protein
MSDKPRAEGLKELRRELNELRAEYESYKKDTMASHRSRDPSDRADFPTLSHGRVADELRRRSRFLRLERRLSAFEQRVAELEAEWADSLSSKPH